MSNINGLSFREQARELLKNKSPKNHIKGLMHTKEEAKNLPRKFTCEKHGEFDVKFSEMSTSKILVNATCSKCVEEFDKLLDEKEMEIEQQNKKRKLDQEKELRIKKLSELGVSKRYVDCSFNNYTVETPEQQNALTKCVELCDTIKSDGGGCNLIMVGGVGTGKTHLANSMVIDLYDNDKQCERINMINMIRELKATWSKDAESTEEHLIKYFSNLDLLIIDEVGVQFNSDTEKMFVFDIIDGRYDNCLPTVIISNLDINGVKEVVGERCIDRLRQDGGKVVAFNWNSYR